jgi:ADP-ribosylglycohydrolase
MTTPSDQPRRIQRMRASLEGLSVGDAFGERFFGQPDLANLWIENRALPDPPWTYTDDTVMAISIVEVLSEKGEIDPDRLAALFAARYLQDRYRGYGGTAHDILYRIAVGEPWREVSRSAFGGKGSLGNGGAMRSAPLGAYFSDDLDALVENARRSAEVTHAHPEGQAGAIAVALAAACAARGVQRPEELFDTILRCTPDSQTRSGIFKASALPLDRDVERAVSVLGNGSRIISQDTVPFCLWCAARHWGQFEDALWTTASGGGDIDTNCAIVGGILSSSPDVQVPEAWRARREPLEHFFTAKN